ncbi:MAG: VanZ family protein [Alphaproteobacteria bacterium]
MRDNTNISTVRAVRWVKSVAIALLAVLTIALFNTDRRFVTVARNVLPNLDFSEQARYWQGTPDGVFLLRADPPAIVLDRRMRRQAFIRQSLDLPVGFGFLRIGADTRVQNQVTGPMWWNRAGIVMYSIDAGGRRIDFWPSSVALPEVSDAWRHHEAVIPVAPTARRMDLYLFMGARHGVFAVRNLTVDGLDNATWFAAARVALAAGWVAAGLWIVVPLFARHWRRATARLALFVLLGTLAGVLAPQPELSNFLHGTLETIDRGMRSLPVPGILESQAPLPAPGAPEQARDDANGGEAIRDDTSGDDSRTPRDDVARGTSARIVGALPPTLTSGGGTHAAHFVVHAVLAFLVLLTFRRAAFVPLFGYLLLTGVSTEIIQYFVTTRTVNPADGALNLAGIASGAIAGWIWTSQMHRFHRTT